MVPFWLPCRFFPLHQVPQGPQGLQTAFGSMPVRPVRPVTPVKPGIIPGTIPKASVGLGGVWANKYVGDIYFIIYIYIYLLVWHGVAIYPEYTITYYNRTLQK